MQENELRSFEVYCMTLSPHNSASRVIRTFVYFCRNLAICSASSVEKWKMERNCWFQRLVGGQCGQDPRNTKVQYLVPLLTCNNDIPCQKSGNDFRKVFNFQFPFQYFWPRYPAHRFFAGHWVAKGFSAKKWSRISWALYDVCRGVSRETDVQ